MPPYETAGFDDQPDEWYVKQEFRLLLHHLAQLPPAERAVLQSQFAQVLFSEPARVDTPRGSLAFMVLGKGPTSRAASLLDKQPATIAWIDAFPSGSVFWDIGANVGVYSLYAAMGRDTRVVAFEPAAVNYFLLAANCEVNGLSEQIDALLIGLSNEKGVARLDVSQFNAGGSFGFRRADQAMKHAARQTAIQASIDQMVEEYGLPCPTHVKIDVPVLTGKILSGGARTLRRPEVRELHIELQETSKSGRALRESIEGLGFVLHAGHEHGGSKDVTFVRP